MTTDLSEDELAQIFTNNFFLTASIQGRVSYLLMSIQAANPTLFASVCSYNPEPILFSNMVYGIAANIYSRPSMRKINFVHRMAFSFLWSYMFNYSSTKFFEWLCERFSHRPYLATFLGFLGGRMLMLHLLAYLYHVDTREPGAVRRDSAFDAIKRPFRAYK